MRLHRDVDVEVAGLAAVAAGVPLARHADPRAVGQPGRHVDRQRLGPHLQLLAAARRAARLPLLPRAAAAQARLREHHVAARRLDRAGAVAVRRRRVGVTCSRPAPRHVAQRLLPRDGDRPLAAAHRLLERRARSTDADRRRAPASRCARRASRWCSTSANRSPKVGASSPRTLTEKSNPSKPNAGAAVRLAGAIRSASYRCRRSASLSVSYASAICRNCAAAIRSPGLMSG